MHHTQHPSMSITAMESSGSFCLEVSLVELEHRHYGLRRELLRLDIQMSKTGGSSVSDCFGGQTDLKCKY